MKIFRYLLSLTLVTLIFTQCTKDDLLTGNLPTGASALKNGNMPNVPPKGTFTVTIKNVSVPYWYFESGTAGSAAALPGSSLSFTFHAGKGHKLSFATMYGFSNDGFYAPDDDGISLFSGDTPLTGDITSMISLWDCGTQVNQEPGPGNPHNGADENGVVQKMSDVGDGFDYGSVSTNLKVTLSYNGTDTFTLTIENLAGSTTAISPIAWVVHYASQYPLFKEGMADYGDGLEALAETGNPSSLGSYLAPKSGYVSPVAPGVWVVHKKNNKPVFTDGQPDYGMGLEQLAEMGDPSVLAASLADEGYESGTYGSAPLMPGNSFTFTVDGKEGEYLSFASMLGKSNDLFFAPGDMGIRLFSGTTAVDGDVTSQVYLWDAGTEVNEYPGAGIGEGPGGTPEHDNVMMVNDGFTYPAVNQMIKVTVVRN